MTTLAIAAHLLLAAGDPSGLVQMPSVRAVPDAARPSEHFDAEAATSAYLATIPPAATARSDAYFEGGYWLILWDFLVGAAISLLLLELGWSARLRDFAEGRTRWRWLQTYFYWVQYLLVTAVLGFPMSFYEDYLREHQYGLATQTFGPWLGDQAKGLALTLVLGGAVFVALVAIVRRLSRTWWLWGAVVAMAFAVLAVLIAPVYFVPIFNTVKPLEDARVKAAVLRLAHANGIATEDVYEMDASKQTTRMSANVSGLANTMRITLNDNLLARGSPEEIEAVTGHEIGHYVLNHVYKFLLFLFVVIVSFFGGLRWALSVLVARCGARWLVRDVSDPAALPLVALLGSAFFFVLTPIFNSYVRVQEHEADMYGLNTARQPDGMAQAAIHLGEYRKMQPGPIEEWIFYDHPSGRNRIHDAMVWKSQSLELFEGQTGK